jgi:hypothetical protein
MKNTGFIVDTILFIMQGLKIAAVSIVCTQLTFGQDRRVFGVVIDQDGIPLPGCTISVNNSAIGIESDINGAYSILANLKDTLVYRFSEFEIRQLSAENIENRVQLKEVIRPSLSPQKHRLDPRQYFFDIKSLTKLKNCRNAKYIFDKNAKYNLFVIFVSELNSYQFTQGELEFQRLYNVTYSPVGSHEGKYVRQYNKLTFRSLNKKYKKAWQNKIRKDAVGIAEALK